MTEQIPPDAIFINKEGAVQGPPGPPPWNDRGAYAAGTAYAVGDAVRHNGSFWKALRASTGVEPTLSNTADWAVISQRGDPGPKGDPGPRGITPRGAWSSTASYILDDTVSHNGSQWRALRPNTNVTPGSSALDWEVFAAKGDTGTVSAATATAQGVGKVSVAPATAGDPIFVGDNDARNANARTPTDGSVTAAKMSQANRGTIICTSTTRPTGTDAPEGQHIYETDTDATLKNTGTPAAPVWSALGGGGSASAATVTALGTIRVSAAPIDPASPIAVGDNDARLAANRYVDLTRTSGAVSLPASTIVMIDWNAENADPQNWHDNAINPRRIAPGSAGVYVLQIVTTFPQGTAAGQIPRGSDVGHYIYRRNAADPASPTFYKQGNLTLPSPTTFTGTYVGEMRDAADYFEIGVAQFYTAAVNLSFPQSSVVVAKIF